MKIENIERANELVKEIEQIRSVISEVRKGTIVLIGHEGNPFMWFADPRFKDPELVEQIKKLCLEKIEARLKPLEDELATL